MSYLEDFRSAMAAAGITPPDQINDDGNRHRFSSSGRPLDKSGWYILHGDERPAGAFGCWRAGLSVTWKADTKTEFSPEEKAAWRKRMQELDAAREAERKQAIAAAAKNAEELWAKAVPGEHPYLTAKQIPGPSTRVLDDTLLVQIRGADKSVVGLQRIYPDGTKRFLKGTPMESSYSSVGKLTPTMVICEGYATAVSVHLATGYGVVIAFNAGNIGHVAKLMQARYPDVNWIIGADDDAFTVYPPNHPKAGEPWNPGIEAAAYTGLPVAIPQWGETRGRGTDFNDLHCAEGLDAVRHCFEDPRPITPNPDGHQRPAHKAVSVGGRSEPENAVSERGVTPQASVGVQSRGDGPVMVQEVAPHDNPSHEIEPHDTAPHEILPAASDQFAPNCSDDDLAARHLQRMMQNTLWCEMWGRWLVWNGDRWLRDETNLVLDAVRNSCRQAANLVLENPELDTNKRQRQADKIASYRTITSVERLARTYRSVATHPDEWDQDRWLLNTPGGVVDLRTGKIRSHSREDRFTKITAVTPSGACPTWLAFLDRATGGNKELVAFLKRMCGYALTGEVREHALFFVYGTGGNGKGTFLNTITHIMGDYQRVSSAETFTESNNDRHTTELARLQGARMVTAQETEEGKRWAESRIKALTGGDPITARYMRQDDFTFLPQFKLVIVGNHKPSFRSVDEAIKRRLHLIPFTATIPASEKDPELSTKLKAESAGILQWMIEGCIEWDRNGLKPPAIVKESTEEYLGAEDSLQQWLDDCCDLVGTGFTTSKALFYSWSKWCEQSGEYVGTMKRLMAKLESRGISVGQKFKGARGCLGIKIKTDDYDYENQPY